MARKTNAKELLRVELLGMINSTSLDKIAIKTLCAGAGVNRASFYYNFASVEDVMDYAVDSVCEGFYDESSALRAAVGDVSMELDGKVLPVWRRAVAFLYERQEEIATLVNAGYSQKLTERMRVLVSDGMTKAIFFLGSTEGEGRLRPGPLLDFYPYKIAHNFTACCEYLVSRSFSDDQETVAEAFYQSDASTFVSVSRSMSRGRGR